MDLCFCRLKIFSLVSLDCSVVNSNPSIKENNDPGVVVTDITAAAGITVTIDPTMNYQWFEINGSQLILKDSVDYEVTVETKNVNKKPKSDMKLVPFRKQRTNV